VSVCLSVCRSVSQSVAILYSLFRVNMVLNIPGVIEHVAECAQDLLVEGILCTMSCHLFFSLIAGFDCSELRWFHSGLQGEGGYYDTIQYFHFVCFMPPHHVTYEQARMVDNTNRYGLFYLAYVVGDNEWLECS
jgi:hypothetical protein